MGFLATHGLTIGKVHLQEQCWPVVPWVDLRLFGTLGEQMGIIADQKSF